MLDLTSKAMLAASIRNRLFASRDTVDEALNYAIDTIERIQGTDKAAVYTMLHVVLNTVADKITALPDQLPEPPAEVRIAHADLPATGATDIEAKLINLIDSRLANWGAALPQREAHLNELIENIVLAQISKLGASIDQKIERAVEEWSENAPFDTIIEEWFDDNVDIETSVKDYLDEHLDESIRESLSNLDLKIKITN